MYENYKHSCDSKGDFDSYHKIQSNPSLVEISRTIDILCSTQGTIQQGSAIRPLYYLVIDCTTLSSLGPFLSSHKFSMVSLPFV